jgi:hypothetical protein
MLRRAVEKILVGVLIEGVFAPCRGHAFVCTGANDVDKVLLELGRAGYSFKYERSLSGCYDVWTVLSGTHFQGVILLSV